MKKVLVAAAGMAALGMAQAPAPKIEFEVASVKLDPSCGPGQGRGMRGRPSPGRLNLACSSVEDLIQGAYVIFANGSTPNMRRMQITGGPGWTRSDLYTVNAKAEGAAPLDQMIGPMLQALLEQRFQLNRTSSEDLGQAGA